MPDRQSPTLRRRRLAQQLRGLREAAGLTSTEVARGLEWNPSKLTRMERSGEAKRYNVRDIRDLCDRYKVTDEHARERLVQLARDGAKKGWWDSYDKMLSGETVTFFGLEAEAAKVLIFEPLAIPGLLQTEEYARAIVAGAAGELADDQAQARVEVRMRRQKSLYESPTMDLVAIVDEAVLHRQVGSPEIMRAQIEHLAEQALLPNVTLHVIPYAVGAHAGMSGSFNILQFPEPGDLDAVFADLVAGQMFIEEPGEVRLYHAAFLHLLGAAASPANTLEILTNR
jgi:transcriptional regulator with XRE-family HTH domain